MTEKAQCASYELKMSAVFTEEGRWILAQRYSFKRHVQDIAELL